MQQAAPQPLFNYLKESPFFTSVCNFSHDLFSFMITIELGEVNHGDRHFSKGKLEG